MVANACAAFKASESSKVYLTLRFFKLYIINYITSYCFIGDA
jgi:hypothetical protein